VVYEKVSLAVIDKRLTFWLLILFYFFSSVTQAELEPQRLHFTSLQKFTLSPLCGYIIKAAYQELNIEIDVENFPSGRATKLAEVGVSDGVVCRLPIYEKYYPDMIKVSVPIYQVTPTVWSWREDLEVTGWESLRPYHIGLPDGIIYLKDKTQGFPRVSFIEERIVLLRMLVAKRLDVVLSFSGVWEADIATFNISGVHSLAVPFEPMLLYHYLHGKHRDIAIQMEEVLAKMQADGRLETIQRQAEANALEIIRGK
jgi:polar amino acid transport system substrate-binding protein